MDLSLLVERVRANDPNWTKLRWVSQGVTASATADLAEALKSNSVVTSLDLTDNNVGDEGCMAMASLLLRQQAYSLLRSLELRKNSIGSKGIAALAQALIDNTTLQELDISQNQIGMEGVQVLADALPRMSGLVQLELAETGLGDDGVTPLARALQNNKTLTTLGLRGNSIGLFGAKSLSYDLLIKHNQTLTILDLRRNQFRVQGTKHLAAALRENKSVTNLDLSSNELGPGGAQAIGELLGVTTTLKIVSLGENQIGDDGMEAIALGLKTNTSITYLDVSANEISLVGADALEETFLVNRTLTHLDMNRNDEGVIAPADSLHRNQLLRDHAQALLERGSSLFVRVVATRRSQQGSAESAPLRLEWTDELWEGARLDEALEWSMIHQVVHGLHLIASGMRVAPHEDINSNSEKDGTSSSVIPPCLPFPTGKLFEGCQLPNALVELVDRSINDEGSNLLHMAMAAQSPVALDFCKLLVSELGASIDLVKDAVGRSAREIGMLYSNSDQVNAWARAVGYFLQRYHIEGGNLRTATPVYRTEKVTVHFARDAWKQRTDSSAEVMIYLMDDPDQFYRELSARIIVDDPAATITSGDDIINNVHRFGAEFVVQLIRFHDELDDTGVRRVCLVFPLLERSLQGIIDLERVSCHEVNRIREIGAGICKSLLHIHQANCGQSAAPATPIIHCNIEPRNIIRVNGQYKLLGFELSTQEGQPVILERVITNSCPPEAARALIKLGSWEEMTNALSELRHRKRRALDAITPDDNFQLLSILSEVHLLRKKMAILKAVEGGSLSKTTVCRSRLVPIAAMHSNTESPSLGMIEKNAPYKADKALHTADTATPGTVSKFADSGFVIGLNYAESQQEAHPMSRNQPGLELNDSGELLLSPGDSYLSETLINGSWNGATHALNEQFSENVKVRQQLQAEEGFNGSYCDLKSMREGGQVGNGASSSHRQSINKSNETYPHLILESALQAPIINDLLQSLPQSTLSDKLASTIQQEMASVSLLAGQFSLTAHRTFDIWSFGVTMYKLFTGEDLFPTNSDGLVASETDQIDLATWSGLTLSHLEKVLSRCRDATALDKNQAKNLLLRCLHPDPTQRPQSMEAVLSHGFLTKGFCKEDEQYDAELQVSPIPLLLEDDGDAVEKTTPVSFLILPCKLMSVPATGKVVAPAQVKFVIDKLGKMQELSLLRHLLNTKFKEDEMNMTRLVTECQRLDGKQAARKLLRYVEINENSIDYFMERILDLKGFKEKPFDCIERKCEEAFDEWWQAYKGRLVYFYLVDEFFLKPASGSKYPIELKPRSPALRDLVPLLCWRMTTVQISTATAFILGKTVALPGRLDDWALAELNKLNSRTTIAEYQVLRQAVNKITSDNKVSANYEDLTAKFDSVDDAMSFALKRFFEEHDSAGEFAGFQRVLDQDGSTRWTCELGAKEMERTRTMSLAENFGHKRQLVEALREAEETLKREGVTAKRLVEEKDALLKDKQYLLQNKQELEDYIDRKLSGSSCCSIL